MQTNKTMLSRFAIPAALVLSLAACTHAPKPAPAPPPPAPRPDPKLVSGKLQILQVQKALATLGYKIRKPDGKLGPATTRALIAFEKDRGLGEDARLTYALADKIKAAAAETLDFTAITVRPGDFMVFSDGEEEVASAERSTVWEQDQPRALVAIRPAMGGWPAAAKAGLDWALTHALDTPATPAPIRWSSTGVEEQFEIRTYPALTPREAALVGGDPSSCRKFELRDQGLRYPGIACRDDSGTWYIPHSTVRLARPAAGLSTGVKSAKAAGKKKS